MFLLLFFFSLIIPSRQLLLFYLSDISQCVHVHHLICSAVYIILSHIFCSVLYRPHPFIITNYILVTAIPNTPSCLLVLVRRLLSSCPVQSDPHHSSSSPSLHTDIHSSLPVVNLRCESGVYSSLFIHIHTHTHTSKGHLLCQSE